MRQMTNRYAIDFQGFIYVESDNQDDARQLGSDILSLAMPREFFEGVWEIVNVEVDNDAF